MDASQKIEAIELRMTAYAPTANAVERSQNASINVNTTIRSNALGQAGMKTTQTVNVNQNGAWSETHSAGVTKVPVIPGISVPMRGFFLPYANVTPKPGTPSTFNVVMRGYAFSTPLYISNPAKTAVMNSIHYSLHFQVNFSTHVTSMHGWHSAFPTFSAQINGREFYNSPERFGLSGLHPGNEVHPRVGDITDW